MEVKSEGSNEFQIYENCSGIPFQNNMLLGLGIMLAAGEVPRIAQQFGLDSSVRVNMSSVIYSTSSAVNLTRNLMKAKPA